MYKYTDFGSNRICEQSFYIGEKMPDFKLYLRILICITKL